MPVLPDPARPPDGRLLVDDAGRVRARFLDDERAGRRRADLLDPEPDAATADALLPLILRDLAGLRVVAPPEVADRLVAAGGVRGRRARAMVRLLDDAPPAPPPPDGTVVTSADRPAEDLVASHMAAFGPGHPDAGMVGGGDAAEVRRQLAEILAGDVLGPVLPVSRLGVSRRDGRVLGGAIITRGPGSWTDPWVAELWREPGARGLGAALLGAVLAAAAEAGHPRIGLVVTHGNPAVALYERHGFRTLRETVNVDVPG